MIGGAKSPQMQFSMLVNPVVWNKYEKTIENARFLCPIFAACRKYMKNQLKMHVFCNKYKKPI